MQKSTRERNKVKHKVWGCKYFPGRQELMQAGGKQGELRVETWKVEKLLSFFLVLGAKTDTITRPS